MHRISKLLKIMKTNCSKKEQGGALVIALIIMLALTLLGLSLLLQSNTEYVISLNERDATAALYNAEAGLQLAEQTITDAGSGPNLTPLLVGPDGNPATPADNGIMSILTVNTGIDSGQLNSDCSAGSTTCERTYSVIETYQSRQYEVFRVGVDSDNDGDWDGPRGLVYVRVEDNADDSPALNDPTTDTDKRVTAHIVSQYPIQVDSNGTLQATRAVNLKTAGVSTRQLIARFGPGGGGAAIVSERNMNLGGSLHVCGECGAVHADLDLTITADPGDDLHICSNATETEDTPEVTGGTIEGDIANAPIINVPTANPYHADYVPEAEWFDTLNPIDSELTGHAQLHCGYDLSSDPAATKYFALVGDGGNGLVYKAYWDGTRWTWKLIDDLNDAEDTTLDDCGRVVSGNVAGIPLTADTNAGLGVDDAENAQNTAFYDFTYSDGGAGNPACNASSDLTLGPGSGENNYADNANAHVTSPIAIPAGVRFPGTDVADGLADYDASVAIGKTRHKWSANGNVYSPLYNAVLFVWGNIGINGDPGTLVSSTGSGLLPGDTWRITFISVGSIDIQGHPTYAPFRSFDILPNNQWLMISGRDIELRGNPGEGDICPASCTDPPANLAGYAGIILAHEQVSLGGNVSINGTVKAEDAAQCADVVTGEGIEATGSVEIYYDCLHPPDDSGEGARLTSWEEVQ